MGLYNFSKSSSGIESVPTSYNVNKYTSITLSYSATKYYNSVLRSIQIFLSSISSANTVSVKITSDVTGDKIIVPDTAATIDNGLTTTSKGVAVIDITSLLFSDVETFYIFPKVDTGSTNIDEIIITYESNEY